MMWPWMSTVEWASAERGVGAEGVEAEGERGKFGSPRLTPGVGSRAGWVQITPRPVRRRC